MCVRKVFLWAHTHLSFIRLELLHELFSQHNRKDMGTQHIIELFSPYKSWPNSKFM